MNNNENQNLNSVVPPTTAPGMAPNPQVPPVPENGGPSVVPVAPAMPQEAPQPTPVPPAGQAPVNLQPEGTVPPVTETPPTPTVAEPLMGTPLNAQTVINPAPSAEPMNPAQPSVGQIPPMGPVQPGVGPIPNGEMMGGIPTPPSIPTEEKKPKKKLNPLILVLVVVLVAAVGFGVYYFMNQTKKPVNTITITPKFDMIELGEDIDTTLASSFVTVSSPIDINSCEVYTDLDPKVAKTYQYTVTCGQYKLENQLVTVSDTTPPVVKLKPFATVPGVDVKADVFVENFIDFAYDFSGYHYLLSEEFTEIDTSVEGTYEMPFTVEDDSNNENSVEVVGQLIISADAPEYYLNCFENHQSSDQYKDAVISNTYRFGINSLGELYNIYRTRHYRFETVESFEDAAKDATEDSFDKYTGNIRVNPEDSSITVSSEVDEKDLEEIYDVDEFPTFDMDIEDFYIDKGFTCEQE